MKHETRNRFFLIWLAVFCLFPDAVDSRFPEQVDNLPDSVDSFLKGTFSCRSAIKIWKKVYREFGELNSFLFLCKEYDTKHATNEKTML
jgi:hypothetical protein